MIQGNYPIKKLGDVAEFLDNLRRPITASNRVPGPYPYYGANGQQDSVAGYLFDEPLILLAEDGGLFDQPDRGIAYAIKGKTWVNNHAHVLRARNDVNQGYLLRVLENYDVTPWINGSTRAKLTKAGASKIHIPIPPLDHQERIAAILDAADDLRAKRRESLAELDTLLQSTFLEMFGDPVTNPKGWDMKRLGTMTDVRSSKRVFVSDLVENGVPFFRGTEIGRLADGKIVQPDLFITKEKYEELKSHTGVPKVGDLLLPSICHDGRIYLIGYESQFYFKDGRVLWIQNEQNQVNSTYLRYHLRQVFSTNYARIASGTTFAELKIFALKELQIQVPNMELQHRFAAIVESVEGQKAKQLAHLDELDTLFASLQSRAFKGEL